MINRSSPGGPGEGAGRDEVSVFRQREWHVQR